MAEQAAKPAPRRALAFPGAGLLALLFAGNLVALAGDVMMCALYPSLAVRYRLPVETVVLLTTPRALAQLGVLALGPLSDRVGRGRVLAGGLFLIVAGAWGGALAPNLAAMAAAQVGFGLGLAIILAGTPAIVGDRFAYGVRGRALGIVRLAMPLALIAVVPGLVALAVRRGAVAPFVALGAAASVVSLLVAWRLPQETARREPGPASTGGAAAWARPRAILLLALTLGLALAPTAIFGFLSAWITTTFGDPARHIGLALTGDGLGALAGAGLGTLLVDRLTKRRAGILGLGLGGGSALALAALYRSFGPAVLSVVGLSASLEVSLIALSALLSEAAPGARGTVMGLWAAALALGTALAPLLARPLWHQGGMGAIAGAGGGWLLLLAVAFALVAVEPGAGHPPHHKGTETPR